MVDYGILKRRISRLEAQHRYCQEADESWPDFIKEALRESVILRFEVCYSCLHKTLRRYLTEEFGIPDIPDSPKSVIRCAFESGLLDVPIEPWLGYAEHHHNTTDKCDSERLLSCLEIVPDFISDAVDLYQTMAEESWKGAHSHDCGYAGAD